MTTDIKELVKRLREHATDWNGQQMPDLEPAKGDPTAGTLRSAALALEAQEKEIDRLTTNGIHTCHDQCQRPLCKSYRELVAAKKRGVLLNKMLGEAEAERDRLKAALRLWQDAWATGRNEPMAIAANATKNELGDAA